MEASIDYASELAEEAGDELSITTLPNEIQALIVEASEAGQRGAVPQPGSRWSEVSRLYRELSEDWIRGRKMQLESKPDEFTLNDARLLVSPRFKLLSALSRDIAIEIIRAYEDPSSPPNLFSDTIVFTLASEGWRFGDLRSMVSVEETELSREYGSIVISYASVGKRLHLSDFPHEARFIRFNIALSPDIEPATHVLLYGQAKHVGNARILIKPGARPGLAPSDLVAMVYVEKEPTDAVIELRFHGTIGRTQDLLSRYPISLSDLKTKTLRSIVKSLRMPRLGLAVAGMQKSGFSVLNLVFHPIQSRNPFGTYGVQIYNRHSERYNFDKNKTLFESLGYRDSERSLFVPATPTGSTKNTGMLVIQARLMMEAHDGRYRPNYRSFNWHFVFTSEPAIFRLPCSDVLLCQPYKAIFFADDVEPDEIRKLAFLQDPKIPERAKAKMEPKEYVTIL